MNAAKALIGSLLAGLASLQQALDEGVTGKEWVAVAIAALTALGVVYGVQNKRADDRGTTDDHTVDPADHTVAITPSPR